MVKTAQRPAQVDSSSAPPAKRRKSEEDDGSAQGQKKARTRVSFSCGECHRRKQKCDRQTPCSHCIARKVPDLCHPYTPGKDDIGIRLSRLEHIIELALPQYANVGPGRPTPDITPTERHRSPSTPLDDESRSQAEEQDPSGGTFQSGKWYGNSASGSVSSAHFMQQLQSAIPPDLTLDARTRDLGKARLVDLIDNELAASSKNITPINESILSSVRTDAEPSAADNLQSLIQDCGVSTQQIADLLLELPPEPLANSLINYYFTSINWTRYPLSEKEFRVAYKAVRASDFVANPDSIRFLPLLFVVLAIAVRLSPERIGGDARQRRLTSLKYYWSSRRCLLISAAIQIDSLDAVLTRLLSARFLTFDRRITECWSQLGAAVRTAQALGLHRDGTSMGLDPMAVEYRRRIWAYLYHADRSYALVLGRPNSIQDDYTSTNPPLNVDLEPTIAQLCSPSALSNPTPMTFVILRHTLAGIIGRMVHHFQQVRTPSHYSDVLALDEELLTFTENLPSYFALHPDTSLDAKLPFIPVHRYLLVTEVLFVRIILHRPYILRKLGSDRYARSRNACWTSAMEDFRARQAFREALPQDSQIALSNAYREFQTAMISGIYLVLEPRGKDADTMHAILDSFLKDHEGSSDMDQTTRREVKTTQFLKQKAEAVRKQRENAKNNGDQEHPNDAHLLLELQQSSRSSKYTHARGSKLQYPHLSLSTASSPSSSHAPAVTSPTIQRLQHSADGANNSFMSSPSASGSPGTDDFSSAQKLLDNWCDAISNGPAMSIDGMTGAPGSMWGPSLGADMGAPSLWPSMPMGALDGVAGASTPGSTALDGAGDWTYWDNLVNQIRIPDGRYT